MKIERIYYEELRSECINGKWTSKKIGAEVEVGKYTYDSCFNHAKTYVKDKLDLEDFEQKTTKQMLEDIRKQAKEIINGM